jgi:1-acyl-sn-glycerol-3-phosphate acyltransferase
MQINQFPIASSFLDKLNNKIDKVGLQEAARFLLKRFKTNLILVNLSPEIQEILSSMPVVVVANHPAEADVVALIAALPTRKDFYLIANSSFCGMMSNFDKYLIPVYVTDNLINKDNFNLKLRIFKKIHSTQEFSEKEAHKKNIQSISLAAEKVREGGLVGMFPGAGKENGEWFSGIGYLISQAKSPDAYIVMINISGTSSLDYLRFIPKASKVFPKFKVRFALPLRMKDYLDLSPKEIAKKLEGEYREWANGMGTKSV